MRSPIYEIIKNKKLILELAKSDYRLKNAGSYVGFIWGFIQPVVTILIYWFVFEVGFRTAPVAEFPFLLWLTVGLIPWFFFSEAITSSTNAMVEYSYLVKKIVFKVDILPFVKVVSSSFTHVFFCVFGFFLFFLFSQKIYIESIQVLYYTVCLVALVSGISYITSAINVFVKDMLQIIGIIMQMIFWLTPIVWNYEIMPEAIRGILKYNPLYYIVEGFRDSFINRVWFFEKPLYTLYFWILVIVIHIVGNLVFKRLKIHFADVL